MKMKVLTLFMAACVAISSVLLPMETPQIQAAQRDAVSVEQTIKGVRQSTLFPYMNETEGGCISNNRSKNEYDWQRCSKPVQSYLIQDTDGTYQRVEKVEDGICIEKYASDFSLKSSSEIPLELPIFGGCYIGETHNFLVFGQGNGAEDDQQEVVRIVKYDKNWNKLSHASVYGANTVVPFRSGSLRMTERDGKLYIHTSHLMYTSKKDEKNHQANMTFVVNQLSMTVEQQYSDIMNISYGYVSHSFNQFIVTDGTYLYRMDHGDAFPRAVVLTKSSVSSITSCTDRNILEIQGEIGDNDTGVSLGGFALAGQQLVAVGNSVDQNIASNIYGVRNIFVASTDTELADTNMTWLTNYPADTTVSVGNPHLVKVSDNLLYVMWEEFDSSTELNIIKIAAVDAAGKTIGNTYSVYGNLSDCVPIYTASGQLVWYVTSGSTPVFYSLDTKNLDQSCFTGKINLSKCTITLEQESYIYDPMKYDFSPAVTIDYGNYRLECGKDYRLVYKDNDKIGEASITVKGQGLFEGTVIKKYQIQPIDISGYTMKLKPETVVYDAMTHEASCIFYDGSKEVYVDGTLSYDPYAKDVGTYRYTFTGKDIYTGTVTADLIIQPRSIADAEITLSQDDYIYNGKPCEPQAEVKVDGLILQPGTDYKVSYQNNGKAGTAKMLVEGIGNYTGKAEAQFTIRQEEHTHVYSNKVTKKAVTSKNGAVTQKGILAKTCTVCGKIEKETWIYAAKKVMLSTDSCTYSGKAKKPSVTVLDSKGKKIDKKYYKVTYKNNSKVGKATVTVSLKGRYKGTLTKTFTIQPKSTSLIKLTSKAKGFTVKWKRQPSQTNGYEIAYSTGNKFTKKTTKTLTIKKNSQVSQNIKKLKGKKKYYVRIRTYKTVKVNGKSVKIYSGWSKAKTVTTKR